MRLAWGRASYSRYTPARISHEYDHGARRHIIIMIQSRSRVFVLLIFFFVFYFFTTKHN